MDKVWKPSNSEHENNRRYENQKLNQMFLDIIHCPVLSSSKNRLVYFSKHVSETGLCLRLHVKPTQFGPIDRASPYLRTPVTAPRWGIQTKQSTNHLRELRKN
jgi:hypothetical protein